MAEDVITSLERSFGDFDIEGDGKVDYISFTTALQQFGPSMPVENAKEIFDSFEKDDEDRIFYSEFISWCRKNKLGGGDAGEDNKNAALMEGMLGPPTEQVDFNEEERAEIERAKVVIQKAMLKKMPRTDVYDFLGNKGVRKDLIDHAYSEVQATTNPQQRIRYYKDLSEQNARESSEVAYENKKLKQRLTKMEEELGKIRNTLSTSVTMVMASYQQTSKSFCPQEVTNEVQEACAGSDGDKKTQLERLLELLQARRFVVAWLLLQTLDFASELSNTQLFLEDFHPS